MGSKRVVGWGGVVVLMVTVGCSGAEPERADLLGERLEADRQAHLTLDAGLLSSGVGDSLIVVDAGRIEVQNRASVRAHFAEYFRGAAYRSWDDVTPPRIRMSPDGEVAVVHRMVAVERTEPGIGVSGREVVFQSAWTATYEWQGDGWRMTSVTSTFLPAPDPALTVVMGARRAIGLEALPSDSVLLVEARVRGPGGEFDVQVLSAPGGEARLSFVDGPTLTARVGGGTLDPGPQGEPRELRPEDLTFLRGHEVQLMLLAPGARLTDVRALGSSRYGGRDALWLRGEDAVGSAVDLFYSAADTMPLGYRVTDHTRPGSAPVTLTWTAPTDGSRPSGAPRYPGGAVFEQGPDRFRYTFGATRWVPRDTVVFGPGP